MSKRSNLYARWKEADNAVRAIVNGAQSATFSDGTGSRSYTKASLKDLTALRDGYAASIRRIDTTGATGVRHIGVEYS